MACKLVVVLAVIPAVMGYDCPSGYTEAAAANCAGSDSSSCSIGTCCAVDTSLAYAKCSAHTCSPGLQLISAASSTNCLGSQASSCLDLVCCEIDPDACANYVIQTGLTCNPLLGQTKYYDLALAGATVTGGDYDTACCRPLADAKCHDVLLLCDLGYYTDSSKSDITVGSIVQADFQSNCCTEKAHCSSATCPSGYELRSDASTFDCATNAASCDSTTCCTAVSGKCSSLLLFLCSSGTVRGNWGSTAGSTTTEQQANCCVDPISCDAEETGGSTRASLPIGVAYVLVLAVAGGMHEWA